MDREKAVRTLGPPRVVSVALLTCAALMVCSLMSARPTAAGPIRFGVQTTETVYGLLWATDPNRWAAKYGVEIQTVSFASGRPSIEAIASGAIDLIASGFGPAISLIAAQPGKYVFLAMYANGDYHATLVKRDSSYREMDELRGKKIGMRIGSGSYVAFLQLLKDRGWKETDFKIVNMDPTDMAAALNHGLIDAMHTWEPTPSIAEAKGLGRRIQSYAKYMWAVMPIFARRDFAEGNRDAIVRFLAAVMESQDFARSEPGKAATGATKVLARKGVDVGAEAFEGLIRKLNWDPDIDDRLRGEMGKEAAVLFEMGRIKVLPRIDLDMSYLAEAKKLRARPR